MGTNFSILGIPSRDLRVLVVASNPGDEAIGCGALVYQLAKAGAHIEIVFLSAAESGEHLPSYALASAAMLGVRNCRSFGNHSWGLKDDLATRTRLIEVIQEFRPNIVLVPHPGDRERQHEIAFRITDEAVWQAAYQLNGNSQGVCPPIMAVIGYEMFRQIDRPTFFVSADQETVRVIREAIALYDHAQPWMRGAIGQCILRTTLQQVVDPTAAAYSFVQGYVVTRSTMIY